MQELFRSYEFLLASASPRRSSLMNALGLPCRVVDANHPDENHPPQLKGPEIALYLAEHKSGSYAQALKSNQILITADTVVWHEGSELGKPRDREDAIDMILRLSGKTHQVFTGVCLRAEWAEQSFVARTDVTFAPLEKHEVEHYVDRFLPFDKAGAYGIQEWIGYIAVENIVGSYFNVMGLPVQKLYHTLKSFISSRK